MTLSSLIRKKGNQNLATAIPAIFAIQPKEGAATVARIATVAVATPRNEKTTPPPPMTAEENDLLWRGLDAIGERNPLEIHDLFQKCENNLEARNYILQRAEKWIAGGRI